MFTLQKATTNPEIGSCLPGIDHSVVFVVVEQLTDAADSRGSLAHQIRSLFCLPRLFSKRSAVYTPQRWELGKRVRAGCASC